MLSLSTPAVTPAEASAYVASLGLAGWPSTEPEQAQAIRRGQRWVAATYNRRWREPFENEDAPELVRFAVIEAAAIEAAQAGALSTAPSIPSQGKVLTKVGEIAWTPHQRRERDSDAVRVPHIEDMLAPLVYPEARAGFLVA